MDEQQRLVFLQSRLVCAHICAIGMQAENKKRETLGESVAYTEKDFLNIIDEFNIHHNGVITEMLGGFN